MTTSARIRAARREPLAQTQVELPIVQPAPEPVPFIWPGPDYEKQVARRIAAARRDIDLAATQELPTVKP